MYAKSQSGYGDWLAEFRATFVLAWPLVVSQLASIALFTTDVVMMGWLGPQFLAAGQLATAIMHPLFVGSVGIVSATAPMIAQAIGARQGRSVRRTVRQGFWVAALLVVFLSPVIWQAEIVFLGLGQVPATAALAGVYLRAAVFGMLPGLLIIALRSLVSARGNPGVILWMTLAGVAVNALGNYALMFGNFGFPRLELLGAGISTSTVNFVMFAFALGFVLIHRRYRRYHILARVWKADWPRFFELLRLGWPIGLTLTAEVGLFGVAVIMMGWLGTNEVAAHAVAVQCAAVAFMVPLGLSQATTVRVGLAYGENDPAAIHRAGWTSLGLAVMFMSLTSLVFVFFPGFLVQLFLDPANPVNATSLALAAGYLGIAALFQLVDGAQVVSLSALRGLSDTRTPMIIATIGYWLFGLPIAYVAGFVFEMRGVGIWLGLAAGLAFVAVFLSIRFAIRERLGLVRPRIA